MNTLKIYTDGACSGNPGPGGWAALLIYGTAQKEISGFVPDTTNNRMEITAVIRALEAVKHPCPIEIYSDSTYVVKTVNDNWKTKKNSLHRKKKKQSTVRILNRQRVSETAKKPSTQKSRKPVKTGKQQNGILIKVLMPKTSL